jgi:hypothetical protein
MGEALEEIRNSMKDHLRQEDKELQGAVHNKAVWRQCGGNS